MIVETFDLSTCLARARSASRKLASAPRNDALYRVADALEANRQTILTANQQDVSAETTRGTKASLIDRLTLSETRLSTIAESVRQIAQLPDPLFRVLDGWRLDNGLQVQKVTVPFGVIGMIYESRPNVTIDAAALTLKAGSSVVLRGSSNALASNRVLVKVMREAIATTGLPADAIQLIDSAERTLVTELLESRGQVDLVIPRGGAGLIQHVVNTAKVPTIETGIGNCHLFVDASADLANALEVTLNAKVQRPGVCNAIETLLVHRDVADTFLPELADALIAHRVTLHGCETTCQLIPGALPATTDDWQTEYLDYELAVRVVDTLDDAIEHITTYGSMHSEAILTRDMANARRFQQEVDAAAVYVNASTRFTDGFELGFGAEIGISTQKLHARGPMGLAEMVTYKYLIEGDGQIRS